MIKPHCLITYNPNPHGYGYISYPMVIEHSYGKSPFLNIPVNHKYKWTIFHGYIKSPAGYIVWDSPVPRHYASPVTVIWPPRRMRRNVAGPGHDPGDPSSVDVLVERLTRAYGRYQVGPPFTIAKFIYNFNFTMVYDTTITSYNIL